MPRLRLPVSQLDVPLDGQLVGTPGTPPPMAGVEDFRKADYGLTPIRSEVWGGFIFITFNADAARCSNGSAIFRRFLPTTTSSRCNGRNRDVYEVDCNWKIWLENAFENYHVVTIHRKHMIRRTRRTGSSSVRGSLGGDVQQAQHRRLLGAAADSGPGRAEGYGLVPHLGAAEPADHPHVVVHEVPSVPARGPDKLRLYENWTFPKSTVERPDFKDIVGPEYYEKYSQIVREDLAINPVVQKAMRCGAYRPGRYSLEEYVVHRIANYVLDRVIGPDSGASRVRARRCATQEAAERERARMARAIHRSNPFTFTSRTRAR